MLLRLIGPVLAWLLCLTVALAGGWAAMWLLVYALGLLILLSLAWTYMNLLGLRLARAPASRRLHVGDQLVEQMTLSVGAGPARWWPRVWLELHDSSDFPGHQSDRALALMPPCHHAWEMRTLATQRGRFRLGPVRATSGDPFGLFRASRQVAGESALIVYPRTVPLARFGRFAGELPGGSAQGTRVPFSTPNVAGIREYQPGDGFGRIHWPSTARTGRLFVREFDLDPATDVWLVLDLNAAAQAGRGPESTEEYAVTAAASIARHLVTRGRAVGLITQTATIPTDRGPRQLERLLEVLAVVRASSSLRVDALLLAETARFARGSSLFVITPAADEAWLNVCQTLGTRGVQSSAVLLEAATFGPAPSLLLLVSSLAASHIPTFLVKQGEPLAQALSMPRSATPRLP